MVDPSVRNAARAGLGEDESFKTVVVGMRREPARRLTRFLGSTSLHTFAVHSPDVRTLERGLLERVFVSKYGQEGGGLGPPIVPDCGTVDEALRAFSREFKRHTFGLTKWTRQQFVASRPGRKRRVYENALEALARRGLQEEDSVVDTFVKAEKLDLYVKPDPIPRVIQPRKPAFNIELGVYIAPLERVVYRIIRRMFGGATVFKGMNAIQQGEALYAMWQDVKDPVAVGLDVHRMDQHVSVPVLSWEARMYNLFFHSSHLRRLCEKRMLNTGVARCYDGKVKYTVRGRRMSGDMDTGLGNCLDMCAAIYSLGEHLGIRLRAANNGDDAVVVLSRADLPVFLDAVSSWFTRIGLPVATEEPVDEFEKIEFCQTHPVFDGMHWCMVRDPRICLDKDACSLKPIRTEAEWNTLRNTVGLSGLALAGHMPVFCEFYEALRRGAGSRIDRDSTPSGFKMLAKGMNMRGQPVTDRCRSSFFRAFDITPDEQIALEEHYRNIRPRWSEPCEVGVDRYEGALGLSMGSVC